MNYLDNLLNEIDKDNPSLEVKGSFLAYLNRREKIRRAIMPRGNVANRLIKLEDNKLFVADKDNPWRDD